MCNRCNVLYVLFHTLFQATDDCRLFSITFCLIFRNTLEISASEDRCFKGLTLSLQSFSKVKVKVVLNCLMSALLITCLFEDFFLGSTLFFDRVIPGAFQNWGGSSRHLITLFYFSDYILSRVSFAWKFNYLTIIIV